jgi:hypothetical protein
MNQKVEQNAKEIERLFRRAGWDAGYGGHDVIGRSAPFTSAGDGHYGIIAFESVVWVWHDRGREDGRGLFQIFHVREDGDTAIWTRGVPSPRRAAELLERYGIPMAEADGSMKRVPEEDDDSSAIVGALRRLEGHAGAVRALETGGWCLHDIRLRLNKPPGGEAPDYILARTEIRYEGVVYEVGITLLLFDSYWVYDLEWLNAPPHVTPLGAREATPVGRALSAERAAECLLEHHQANLNGIRGE